MSISRLHQLNEVSHEIRMLNADIRKYEREIQGHLEYIAFLRRQFCSPTNTINKYVDKIDKINHLLERLRKDRWFARKEKAMLKQGHDYG